MNFDVFVFLFCVGIVFFVKDMSIVVCFYCEVGGFFEVFVDDVYIVFVEV